MDGVRVAQDREIMNTVMKLWVQQEGGKRNIWETNILPKRTALREVSCISEYSQCMQLQRNRTVTISVNQFDEAH
jgi:hypothetical protein